MENLLFLGVPILKHITVGRENRITALKKSMWRIWPTFYMTNIWLLTFTDMVTENWAKCKEELKNYVFDT